MTERVLRKTVELIQRPAEGPTSSQTRFTTEPKTRWRKRQSISGNGARDFMLHLWREGTREPCHYKALKIKFIQYFETNDPRVYEKVSWKAQQRKTLCWFKRCEAEPEQWRNRPFNVFKPENRGSQSGLNWSFGLHHFGQEKWLGDSSP